jgi:hypothetical protein
MVARKQRIPVVLDTNVFVRAFKSRSLTSPNQRVVRLWLLEKRLQLIVSQESIRRTLKFPVVTPNQFLETLGSR